MMAENEFSLTVQALNPVFKLLMNKKFLKAT